MLGAQVKRSAFVEPRGPIATSGRSEKRRKEKKGGECVRKEGKRKERKSFFLFFFVVELLISTIEIVSARVANFVESRKARRHRDYWFIEACTAVRRYCISCITRARSSCCYTGICCIGYLAWIQRRDIDRSTRGAIRELVFPNWANYIYICVCLYIYIYVYRPWWLVHFFTVIFYCRLWENWKSRATVMRCENWESELSLRDLR